MSEHNLDYKTGLSENVCKAMDEMRGAFMIAEKAISDACLTQRETSLAYTKLEEALMWGIKSLAVHGTNRIA